MALFDIFKRKTVADNTDVIKPVYADWSALIKRDKRTVISKPTNSESFEFNTLLVSLHRIYKVDSIVKQTVLLYTEMCLLNGFKIVSKDPDIQRRVTNKIHEIELLSGVSMYNIIRDLMRHLIAYGNLFIVFNRNGQILSGKAYVYQGYEVNPISSIQLVHPVTMSVQRDTTGYVKMYKQDLSLLQREFGFLMSDPDVNVLLGLGLNTQYSKTFKPCDVAHIKYDEDQITGFGRPFYFETIDDLLLMRKIERILEELISNGRLMFAMYNVGNNQFPATSQKQLDDVMTVLQTTEPFGVIVAPHNHSISITSADNLINSLVNFYDRIRHRVYGLLGISSIMMGETGLSNKASADTSTDFAYNKARDFQNIFALQFGIQVLEHIVASLNLNPQRLGDLMPQLVFNDPDVDMLIKKQNHAVFLYEHNLIMRQEMRNMLGLHTDVDDNDMFVNRVSSVRPKLPDDTLNRVMPQNQWTQKGGS